MQAMITAREDDLRDLAVQPLELLDDTTSQGTGIRLVKWLGSGGFATVFLAEYDQRNASGHLHPLAPPRLALKIITPAAIGLYNKANVPVEPVIKREVVALARVMERRPPCDFVVGFYGNGSVNVEYRGRQFALPWLALEYVDGGNAGTTLEDRVVHAQEGVDPIRANRLARAMIQGVSTLHQEGIIHRDLKPENIFVSGPVDDETPKIGDCGIARTDGIDGGTINASTDGYAPPEQVLSSYVDKNRRNPLIGTWSDVHALAATIWYVMGGEPWFSGGFGIGATPARLRSLRTARHLHPGYANEPEYLARLDGVLGRAASSCIPKSVWASDGAKDYSIQARQLFGESLWSGVERYETVQAFADELMPLLAEGERLWRKRANRERMPATAFRSTHLASVQPQAMSKLCETVAVNLTTPAAPGAIQPGAVVFQADGNFLAKVDDGLLYFVGTRAHRVAVPSWAMQAVQSTRWLVRGPLGGFALVGTESILLVRAGQFSSLACPTRDGAVGRVQAVVGDGRVFGVVTEETDDSAGGPEYWQTADGTTWLEPHPLPVGGDVHAIASGPYGYLVVGSRNGTAGRAASLGLDGVFVMHTQVNKMAPLTAAVCGSERESWATGPGGVVRIDRGGAISESTHGVSAPIAIGLDLVGVPWLLTQTEVLRRHTDGPQISWKVYYSRPNHLPPLVAFGFTPEGVKVIDSTGNAVIVKPWDLQKWRNETRF